MHGFPNLFPALISYSSLNGKLFNHYNMEYITWIHNEQQWRMSKAHRELYKCLGLQRGDNQKNKNPDLRGKTKQTDFIGNWTPWLELHKLLAFPLQWNKTAIFLIVPA